MKAALCKSLDGPQSLVVETMPEPSAGPGQAIVRVKAVGLNFADTLITRGKYQWKPDLPFSPGAEIAGVVESISGEHPGLSPGQRVMAYVNWGGARQKITVDAGALIPVPAAVPMNVAAGLSVTYGTAMHGLLDRGRLKSGEAVVVTGAAGGAGQAAIEIAKLMGARVIAVASSPEKCAVAKAAGADETIEFPGTDLKAAVRALTGGEGRRCRIRLHRRRAPPSRSSGRLPGRVAFLSSALRRARFRRFRSTSCCSEVPKWLAFSGARRFGARLSGTAPTCCKFSIGSQPDD